MAEGGGYNVSEAFDVHIFNCQAKDCVTAINELEKAFSGRCRCIAQYEPRGLKKEWFLAYLKSSRYTIIHICHTSKRILDILPKDYLENVMCVQFNSERIKIPYGSALDFSDFVHSSIETPADVEKFVSTVVRLLSKHPARSPSSTHVGSIMASPPKGPNGAKSRKEKGKSIDTGKSIYGRKSTYGGHDKTATEKEKNTVLEVLDKVEQPHSSLSTSSRINHFQAVPTLFGENGKEAAAYIVVPEGMQTKESLDNALETHSSITEAIDNLCCSGGGEIAQHIVYKMLPGIFESCKTGNGECMLSLASVALCKHPGIQQWALTLLELACLGHTITLDNASDLREIQNRLIQLAERLSGGSDAMLEDESCTQLFHRVGSLLLLLQANITSACSKRHTSPAADDGCLPDIASLSSEMTSKKSFSGIARLVKVSEVLKAAKRKISDEFYEQFMVNLRDKRVYPETKKLLGMDWDTQVLVIVECLKQIFQTKDRDCTSIPFLKDYLRQRTLRGLITRRPNKICQELVLRGLAHFLFYSLEKNTDIKVQCELTINIIDSLWEDNKIQVDFIVARLLFDSVPMIRHRMLELYGKNQLYLKHLPIYLINEVECQLSPCLSVDKNNKEHCSEHEGWLIFRGRFANEEAVVMVHRPDLQAHRDRNVSQLVTGEDRLHSNQLKQLSQLRHPHIVSLLAFKTKCIPQFYIMQSYGIDLQTELQNRRENQQLYTQRELLKLLVQVASAVEYCHSQGIVHRNLTAASLSSISGSQQRALLGSFKLARKLENGVTDAIFEDDSSWLMTRWCAPESLRSLTFSRESDVWMLGVLIYEVLTHGILPHSDWRQDRMLVKMFFPQLNAGNPPSLPIEPCLNQSCQAIIRACCQYLARDRPSVAAVKSSLEGELTKLRSKSQNEDPSYPELSSRQKPSTECSKGVPSITSEDLQREYSAVMQLTAQRDITNILKLFRTGEMCVFRGELENEVSTRFVTKLHSGILEPWVPPVLIEASDTYSNSCIYNCHLPSQGLMGSLFDVCASKKLGRSLVNYVELLLHWTSTLRRLHEKKVGLADFCAHTLWVQQLAGKCQVYPVSLAYLWHREDSSSDHCIMKKLKDDAVQNRCAPELLKEGKAHEAGDIFALGVLIWQVLHAFYQEEFTARVANEPQAAVKEYNSAGWNVQWAELQSKFSDKFPNCPTRIVDLLCSCVAPDPQRRPKWPEIRQMLESTVKHLKKLACQQTPREANPSLPRSDASSLSYSSTVSLPLANPSDGPDTSTSPESSLTEHGPPLGYRQAGGVSAPRANPSYQSSNFTADCSLDGRRDFTVGYVMNQDLGDRLYSLRPPAFPHKTVLRHGAERSTKSRREELIKKWMRKERPSLVSESEESLSEGSDFETTTKALMWKPVDIEALDKTRPQTAELGRRLSALADDLYVRYKSPHDIYLDTLSERKSFMQDIESKWTSSTSDVLDAEQSEQEIYPPLPPPPPPPPPPPLLSHEFGSRTVIEQNINNTESNVLKRRPPPPPSPPLPLPPHSPHQRNDTTQVSHNPYIIKDCTAKGNVKSKIKMFTSLKRHNRSKSVGSNTKAAQTSNVLAEMGHRKALRQSTDPLPSIPTEEITSCSETNKRIAQTSTGESFHPESDYFSIPYLHDSNVEDENIYESIHSLSPSPSLAATYASVKTDGSGVERPLSPKFVVTSGLREAVWISRDPPEPLSNQSHLSPYSLANLSSNSSVPPVPQRKRMEEPYHEGAEVKISGLLRDSFKRSGLSEMFYSSQDLSEVRMLESLVLKDSDKASPPPELSPTQPLPRSAVVSHSNPESLENVSNEEDFVGIVEDFVGNEENFVGNEEDFVGNEEDFVGNIGNKEDSVGNELDFVGNELDFDGSEKGFVGNGEELLV